jgi:hypothetical protein
VREEEGELPLCRYLCGVFSRGGFLKFGEFLLGMCKKGLHPPSRLSEGFFSTGVAAFGQAPGDGPVSALVVHAELSCEKEKTFLWIVSLKSETTILCVVSTEF